MLRAMADRSKGHQALRPYLDRKNTLLRRVQQTTPLNFLRDTGLIASRPVSAWWWKEAEVSSAFIRTVIPPEAAEAEGSLITTSGGEENIVTKQMGISDDTLSDEFSDAEASQAAWSALTLPKNAMTQTKQDEVKRTTVTSKPRRFDRCDDPTNTFREHGRVEELVDGISLKAPQRSIPEVADVSSSQMEVAGLSLAKESGFEVSTTDSQSTGGIMKGVAINEKDIQREVHLGLFEKREGQERDPMVWLHRLANPAAQKGSGDSRSDAHLIDSPAPLTSKEAVPSRAGLDALRPTARHLTFQSFTGGTEQKLSESARRMLMPLVGIDPATVRIREHARPPQVSSSAPADAISGGNTVVIGPNSRNETPEHLGLIAHELTHVARGRQPRFIPPVAARKRQELGEQSWSAGTEDEEETAQLVENRVRAIARNGERSSSFEPSAVVADNEERPRTLPNSSFSSDPPEQEINWAGLPAPWQSLPKWMNAGPGSDRVHTSSVVSLDPVPQEHMAGSVQAPQIHAASADRAAKDDPPEHGMRSDSNPFERVAGPDPAQLAGEVYEVLKRRLAAERRRTFR